MLIQKLHLDEVDIDTDQVTRMIAEQFPRWAALGAEPFFPAGTDNVMFRIGDTLVARLPRTANAALLLEKERIHQQRLLPFLPAKTPRILETGHPTADYPFPWTVSLWIPGCMPTPGHASRRLAISLARFIRALHSITPPPPTPELTSYRGGLLADRDLVTRTAINDCEGHFDTEELHHAWDIALQSPVGDGPASWIHTDLHPGNILIEHDDLAGVIDWGGLAVGDPAVDLIVAWNLLDDAGRLAFRASLATDVAMWARGRAWALSIGLVAYPYYVDSNPSLAAISKYQIEQVLADLR